MLHAQWRNNLSIPFSLPSSSPRPHSSPKQPCVNGSHHGCQGAKLLIFSQLLEVGI